MMAPYRVWALGRGYSIPHHTCHIIFTVIDYICFSSRQYVIVRTATIACQLIVDVHHADDHGAWCVKRIQSCKLIIQNAVESCRSWSINCTRHNLHHQELELRSPKLSTQEIVSQFDAGATYANTRSITTESRPMGLLASPEGGPSIKIVNTFCKRSIISALVRFSALSRRVCMHACVHAWYSEFDAQILFARSISIDLAINRDTYIEFRQAIP